jgi:hypothetical protein
MSEELIPDASGKKPVLEAVLKSLGQLTEVMKSRPADRPKDKWDKVNALSPFVTGLIVAVVGGLFTFNESRRNEILKRQEIAEGDRQAAQDTVTKEHQARILELQTIAQLMPYLTSKNENSKQVAITAIKALSNTSLAIELAALNRSPGTISAVRQIATHSTNDTDRKLAQAALVELERPIEGPNKTLLKTEEGDCGPEGSGGDSVTNVLKNRTDIPSVFHDEAIEVLKTLEVPEVNIRRDIWAPRETLKVSSLGEGRAIRVQGYIIQTKRESSTSANCESRHYVDWHVYIGPSSDIIPQEALIAVAGPRVRLTHPNWTLERLQKIKESGLLVRVSGWQFLDQLHRPQIGRFIATTWEVRPVLRIEFFRDQSWLDLDETTP